MKISVSYVVYLPYQERNATVIQSATFASFFPPKTTKIWEECDHCDITFINLTSHTHTSNLINTCLTIMTSELTHLAGRRRSR